MTWNGSVYGGTGAYYSTTHPLKYMMVQTWDDYEEGSEIETGISNCLDDSSFALSVNSQTHVLSWSFNFADTTWGTMNTVDHYVLYYSTDGTNYFVKDSNISISSPNCNFNSTRNPQEQCSINLNNYTWSPGSYTLYVQAAGGPAITNNMSANSVAFTK